MNRRQASFSGSLLQEMQDIGALMAAEPGAAPESARMPIPKAITKAGR